MSDRAPSYGQGANGNGAVDRWLAQGSGIGYPETRAYVDRVERLKGIYRDVWGRQLAL